MHTQYGIINRPPFGMLRVRAVEFLAQASSTFQKEIHVAMQEADLLNKLINACEVYPFNNVL